MFGRPKRANSQALSAPEPPIASHKETLELINTEIANRLARQNDYGAKVENKAIILAGFAATVGQLLIGHHPAHPLIAIFAVAADVCAIGSAIMALKLSYGPEINPRQLYEAYADKEKETLLRALAATRVILHERNEKIHERKVRWWWASLWSLAVGVLLAGVSLVQTGTHAERVQPTRSVATRSATARSVHTTTASGTRHVR